MRHATLALFLMLVWVSGAVSEGFIQVSEQQFIKDGQPYYYAGTNFWYGMNLASSGPGGDRARLQRELDTQAALGIRNLRVMAGSEGPADQPWRIVPPLQTAPGIYDGELLDGLDYLLKAMGDRGLHAVMCLSNFWHWSGGLAQYVSWNGGGPIPYPPPEPGGDWNVFQEYAAQFYSSAGAKQDYQDHVSFLLSRVNTYTGLSYVDDPTIMAWELANEPRGFHTNAAAFGVWIDETAAFIKSLDANHLVTTGCEGDTPWPDWNGLDFTANHDGPAIDYGTVHIWPENWGWYDPVNPEATYALTEANAIAYLAAHADAATTLGIPLVLEEFGLARDGGSYDPASSTDWRNAFLGAMYVEVQGSAAGGGPLAGDNVWCWAGEGRPLAPYGGAWSEGDPWCGDPPHEPQGWYSVYDSDTATLTEITTHAAAMMALIPETAVDDQGERGELHLDIHPSPALGQTWIAARLPAGQAQGRLEIFDVQGRLRDRHALAATSLGLTWPAAVQPAASFGAGVYIARLSCAGASIARKFILLQ